MLSLELTKILMEMKMWRCSWQAWHQHSSQIRGLFSILNDEWYYGRSDLKSIFKGNSPKVD